MRNGRCGCLVLVMPALHEILVPKFPLTQRRTPPPACLLRVTNDSADSAPARAPSTLVRWRIGHLHIAGAADTIKRAAFLYCTCQKRFRTHINGARAGALLAPQFVTRRRVAGGDVQPLQSLQFRDYSVKTQSAPQEHALTYRLAPAGFLGARLCQKYRNIVAKMV